MQFFSVLLGVLLALLISQWTNHRQQEAQARATLRHQQSEVHEATQAIRAELAQNRNTLHVNVTLLYAAATKLLALPKRDDKKPLPCGAWGNIVFTVGVPDLTDAAYQIAVSTNALSYMPFKRAEMIGQIYGGQRTFKQLAFPRFIGMLSSPHTLDQCAEGLLSFAKVETLFSANYAVLIGPDRTPWPKPPVAPPAKSSAPS